MSSIERAWAAGFWDGEGCVSASYRPGTSQVPRIVCQIAQIDREVLDRFSKTVEFGNVTGPYQHANPNASDYWCWRAEGMENLQRLSDAIYEYLGTVKRAQIENARMIRAEWEAGAVCSEGHRLTLSESKKVYRCLICQSVVAKKNMLIRWGDRSTRTHKPCTMCKADLPLEAFNRNGRTSDGRQTACRECMKKYHKERIGG